MPIAVVEFEPRFLPALREIFLRSRRAAFTWDHAARFTLDDLDAAIEGETILVAIDNTTVIGFVSWWPPEHFIHHLFVDPDHQGRGVGSTLLAASLQRLGRPARLKCNQGNARALAFYRARGWTTESPGTGPDGEYYLMAFDDRPPTANPGAGRIAINNVTIASHDNSSATS